VVDVDAVHPGPGDGGRRLVGGEGERHDVEDHLRLAGLDQEMLHPARRGEPAHLLLGEDAGVEHHPRARQPGIDP